MDHPDGVKEHIQTCVKYIRCFAKKLDRFYHSKGYLHLDIKPENVFVFADEDVLLRLFDFDSMQSLDGLFRAIKDQRASVYTTPPPNGPYDNEVKDINRLSAKVEASEQLKAIDYYALGNLFHFMLYGCFYEDQETEPDEALTAYLEQYPALKEYLNDLFGAHFFVDLGERIHDIDEADQDFSHIDTWFFQKQEDFLQSFNAEYLGTHFDRNMMPALCYQGEDFQGRHRLYQLLQKTSGSLQIIGQGGSGKSTLLKHFAYLSAALFSSWKLTCCYVELHNLIHDIAVEQLTKKIKESQSRNGIPVIWLLDAFDEIQKESRANQLLEQLNQMDVPGVRIIISSRNKIGRLDYPVVQMMALTNEQRRKLFRPAELKELPFDFEENDFLATPLAINLIKGMNQYYNGNKSQSFQAYLIGERQSNGTIKISSLGELVWNYLHIITLSSALDSDMEVDAAWNLLHRTLTNVRRINGEARRLEYGAYDDPSPYSHYKGIPEEEFIPLKRFERLNFYSIIDISHGAIHGHKIEFAHKVFEDFFSALNQYHVFENLTKIPDKAADEELDDYIRMNLNNFPMLIDIELGDDRALEPKSDFSLCKNMFHSSPDKREILLSCLNIFRTHFDKNPFEPDDSNNTSEYTYSVLQILNLLYIYENGAIVFRNLDLSGLALGELFVYDNFPFIRSQSKPVFGPDGVEVAYEDIVRKDVVFEHVNFDGSLLLLKSYCWYQFKNCSFNNLNENSFIHPSLNIPGVDACCAVGQDLYTINRSALMDCTETGDTAQEIAIFPHTEYVDWEFAKHYTKRMRPIHIYDGNTRFWLDESGDALFQDQNTLCFANDSTIHRSICHDNLEIRFAAFWHCGRLETLRFVAGDAAVIDMDTVRIDTAPLSKCGNLRMLEFDGVPIIIEALFEHCPQIKGIHLLSDSTPKEYPSMGCFLPDGTYKECLHFPDTDGIPIPYSDLSCPFRTHPLIFVHHDLVQTYLDNPNWNEYFIYDEKRRSELNILPAVDSDDWQRGQLYDAICEEDGFTDSSGCRGICT